MKFLFIIIHSVTMQIVFVQINKKSKHISKNSLISSFTIKTMISNDPLHGKTLQVILTELVHHFGWEHLASVININCFKSNPSINSSLKFLRKTEWARKKVEALYIDTML